MKTEIAEKKSNPLMKREEVLVSLEHPGKATPGRKEILPEISKGLKADKELVIIDRISTLAGKTASNIKVFIYGKKEDIPKGKLEKMKRRMEKKAAAEKPAEGEKAAEKETAAKTGEEGE